MDIRLVLVGAVLLFFVFIGIKFKGKTKMLENFPYQPDEKKKFEEEPIKVEQFNKRGISIRRTRHILKPVVQVTNKHIIIGQKMPNQVDIQIYTVFTFEPLTVPSSSLWWKYGYIFIPVELSSITASTYTDGGHIIKIPIRIWIPILSVILRHENVYQTMKIYTRNLVEYEKVLGIQIPITE